MSHTVQGIPELDRSGLRKFGFTTGAIIAVVFGLFFPWLLGVEFALWPWILFASLSIIALVAPAGLRPVYRGWMRFGIFMSRITTPLIMGLVFFLVITPVALILKLIKKDPLRRNPANNQDSYRIQSHGAEREQLERPY